MDPAEYKHVVLGLLFLKYVSDAFEDRSLQLATSVSEPTSEYYVGDAKRREKELAQLREDPDEFTAEHVFWVPPAARWEKLRASARQPNIGKLVDDAMDAVEKANPTLKGSLPKVYALPNLDKDSLGKLIDTISNIGLGSAEDAPRTRWAASTSTSSAASRAPRARAEASTTRPIASSASSSRCSSRTRAACTTRAADRAACSCRASSSSRLMAAGRTGSASSVRSRTTRPGSSPDLVDCMVALPGQLFYSTQIPVCLWFLTRSKKGGKLRDRRGETLFIDARKLGTMVDRTHCELNDESLAKVTGAYHAWRGEKAAGKYEDVPGFCMAAKVEGIRKHGHVLTPGRYVGAEVQEDDGEPFEAKVQRLVARLKEQQAEASELDAAIVANLKGLGHGG